MKKLLFLLVFALPISLSACINYYHGIDKAGNFHEDEDLLRKFNMNFNKKLNVEKIKELEQQLKEDGDYTYLSDYAVHLLNLGKTKVGLQLLAALHKKYPDAYQIAANLGTAYELNGLVDSALHYIQLGMRLNPDAHEGSEWVHVKVLETKLALAKNSDYLKNNTVLQLTDKQEKSEQVGRQINIQVRERFPFCPGPNAIMASLLEDMGDCYANTTSIEYAKALYVLAKEYYGAKSPTIGQKINEMLKYRREHRNKQPPLHSRGKEGSNLKMGGIPYKTLLENHDVPSYQVDWRAINTDVTALLFYVGIQKITKEEAKEIPVEQPQNELIAPKEETANSTGYKWLLGLLIGLGLGLILWKTMFKAKTP